MNEIKSPDLSAPDGHTDLDAMKPPGIQSYVSGEPDGNRIRVRYYRRDRDGAFLARAWFGPGTEGPPGNVHGGCMAALLDECMGAAAWLAGHMVVAVHISIDYRTMVPLGTVATVHARIEHTEGRKVEIRSRLVGPSSQLYCEGRALFVELAAERFGVMAESARHAREKLDEGGDQG